MIGISEGLTFGGNNNIIVGDNREQDRLDMASWGSGATSEVYTVFEDYSAGPSNPHIYFKKSVNGGNTFLTEYDFLQDGGSTDKQLYPAIDVYDKGSSREIAVAYLDNSDGSTSLEYYIMVQTSSDGGDSWMGQVPVTDDAHTGYPNGKMKKVDIAYDNNGNLFVVWAESPGDRIKMAYSDDGGSTWSAPQFVRDHTNPENDQYTQTDPTIAADGNYVAVSWQADPDYREKVYVSTASYSDGSGHSSLSFSNPHAIAKPVVYPMYKSYNPRMVAEPGKLHIIWWDFSTDSNGNNNQEIATDRPCIKYTSSDNGGSTWAVGVKDNVIVNGSDVDGWHSPGDIEVGSNGLLAVSWVDTTNGFKDVFAATSTDSGATWSAQDRCNDFYPQHEKEAVRVAIDSSDNVHVSWMQREGAVDDMDIYHSKSIVNLPPEAVQNLMVVYTEEYESSISWTINREPDFKEYNIHMNKTEGFTPGPGTLEHKTSNQGLNLYDITNLVPATKYYVKVEVVDKLGLSAMSEEVSFTTVPINQPPFFTRDIPTLYMIEDEASLGALNMSYWKEMGWVDDDNYAGQTELQFDIVPTSEDPKINAMFRDRNLENPYWLLDLRPVEEDWAGTEEFRINVTDAGKDGGFGSSDDRYSLSKPFDIVINSTNDVPSWSTYIDINTGAQILIPPTADNITLPAKDTGCIERQKYEFAIIGSDIDGDFITFSVIDDPRIEVSLDPVWPDIKSLFTFIPDNDDVPKMNFTIQADDGWGGVRNLTIFIAVSNVNDAPFFIDVEGTEVEATGGSVDFSVMELGTLKFNVTAGDIDPNDSITLSTPKEEASIKKNSAGNWTVTYRPSEADALEGNIFFDLQLLDLAKTDLVTLKVNVEILNRQDRPNWIPGQDRITVEFTYDLQDENEWGNDPGGESIQAEWGEDITIRGFAQDKDLDPLTFTWWITNLDGTKNNTLVGKEVTYAFSPSERNLSDPGREKFRITLIVDDGFTEPIEWFRELWIEKDADNDNDGMPDARELFFWGDLSHEPDDDEDSDDYTNVEEIGFAVLRYESEMKIGSYSINGNEVNPIDPEVYPGHVKPITEEPVVEEDNEPLGLPTWLFASIIIVIIIIVAIVVGFLFIITMSKRKERKEEEDIEKRVAEMDKKAKEKSGLYGKDANVGKDDFGPDQSTLSDLQLDLGGSVYHEDGAKLLGGKLEDEELEGAKKEEKKKSTGPAWESGTGPLFDSSVQGMEFGHSLQIDEDLDLDNLDHVDEDEVSSSMDALLNAADDFDEDAVKDAGGNVLTGAVPMEDQIKQMQGQQGAGGPRVAPPGMEGSPQQSTPPSQKPPNMQQPPKPKVGLPKIGED